VPRRRRRAATGGRRGREEPDEGEAVCNRSEADPEQDAAVNTDDAPPTSSSLRRLHRQPDVSRPAAMSPLASSSFLVLACGRAFEPHAPSAPRSRFLMDGRCVEPHLRDPDTVATPGRNVRALSLASGCVAVSLAGPGTPPRRAAVPCAVRVSCLVSRGWPLCRVGLCREEVAVAMTTQPSATDKPAPTTPRRCSLEGRVSLCVA
jgi:hypothetical protein